MHHAPGRRWRSNISQCFWFHCLRSKIQRLQQVRIKARPRVNVLRMHRQLREHKPLHLVHLSRFVDLFLQVAPLLMYALPRGAHFVRSGLLHFVLFLLRLVRRDKPQHSIRSRRRDCMQSHCLAISHHQFVELYMDLTHWRKVPIRRLHRSDHLWYRINRRHFAVHHRSNRNQ